MGILRALGLGKDPHVEWLAEDFGAKPGEIVVNRLYESSPRLCRWKGRAGSVPLSFYTDASNKYRGGASVYLGKAGPRFLDGTGDYLASLYRPRVAPTLSIDDPRWPEVMRKALDNPSWGESFPEEAFERGLGMGRFALEPDGPDPRAVFPHLGRLREPADAMSEAVETVYFYPQGVAIGLRVERLTRESLVSDVGNGCRVLDILTSDLDVVR